LGGGADVAHAAREEASVNTDCERGALDVSVLTDKIRIAFPVAVLAAMLLAPMSASADVTTFSNDTAITVPDHGPATPSSSTVSVSGLRGNVVDVEVALNGVTHTDPSDLDILLVPPSGPATVLMSDACGAGDVANYNWTFKSTGSLPFMPPGGCPDFYYRPTNLGGFATDNWPDVPPSVQANGQLTSYHGKVKNGDWSLYVVDDAPGDSGRIARGWSLTLTTGPVDALLPGSGTSGPADPYPSVRNVSTSNQVITDMTVYVGPVAHDRPDDIDLLLVGPDGQKVMLMSDACGTAELDASLYFKDQGGPLPDDANQAACTGYVKPTDYEPGDRLPPPAPDGPYATSLSAFDLTDPNGEWKLYAYDDADGEWGYIRDHFQVGIATRTKATVAFIESAVDVAEGSTRALTIGRTGAETLGEGPT
jgi:subtilisin-like proprotein convertase family protein